MLAGVGVPDLRGSQSKGTFYTQDRTAVAEENEQLVFLDSDPRSGAEIDDACDRPAQHEGISSRGYFLRSARARGQGGAQAGDSDRRLALHD